MKKKRLLLKISHCFYSKVGKKELINKLLGMSIFLFVFKLLVFIQDRADAVDLQDVTITIVYNYAVCYQLGNYLLN